MSFDLGSVTARIDADLTGFKNGIKEAQRHTHELGDTVGKLGDGIADFGKKAAVMTGVVAAGFGLLAKNTIESASNFQQTGIAFRTMVGDAEKANQLLKDISKFSRETPFELDQVLEGSKRLLAYNVAAEKVIPTMEMLGNIASGVGRDKLPQLILAYGQVSAATKLTGMELRQFSEAGVPLLQALVDQANKAGGSWQTVGGAAKKTKVDVGELNDKLAIAKKRLDEASASGKAKESTLMSLRNTIQNYEQKIKSASGATSKLGKVWVETKVTAEQMIDKVSKGEIKFADVQKALEGMTSEGGKFNKMMWEQNKTLPVAISNIKQSFQELGAAILGVSVTGEVAEGSFFARITEAAIKLSEWVESVRPQIQEFTTGAMNTIIEKFNQLIEILKPFGQWVVDNKETVLTFIQGLAIAFGALLVIGTVAALIAALTNPLTLVALAIGALYTAWQTNFLGIRDTTTIVVNGLITFFNEYLRPAIEAVVAFFQRHWDSIKMIVSGAIQFVRGVIEVGLSTIFGLVKLFLALISGDWGAAWEAIRGLVSGAWEGIKNIFNGALNFIKGWGGMLLSELVRPFQDAWNRISDFVNKIRDALDFTKRHSPSVVDIVNKGVGQINKALSGLNFSVQTPAVAGLAVQNSSTGPAITQVRVDLNGAMIADEFSAGRIGEVIGDSIVRRLGQNLRY